MFIKFSELPIPFGADYLGVDNWQGWWDTDEALEELYPDYAKDYDSCQGVAEAMNNASKTDVLRALIQEQDHINVLIEPGHEA